jgi:hypothetical protein
MDGLGLSHILLHLGLWMRHLNPELTETDNSRNHPIAEPFLAVSIDIASQTRGNARERGGMRAVARAPDSNVGSSSELLRLIVFQLLRK